MNKIELIKEKTAELLQYCHEYYGLDAPTISDKEYDAKFDELKQLEDEANFWLANSPTRQVQGQVLNSFAKVTHSKPMLSAAKTKDINEIKRFVGDKDFYCSYKLDGLTLIVIYENGKFKQAITRGTGTVGEDVTEQAKMIGNLPMTISYDGYLELRGECVISWENFNKINEILDQSYSHPRNLAAGSLRQLDTNIIKSRNLSYVVFECVSVLNDVDGLINSKELELRWLDSIGFETVGRCVGGVDDCVEGMQPEWYQYPVDGLIFEYNDKTYSQTLFATSHHEGCRIALKWIDDVYETTLTDVVWQTSRSGVINPVAVFEEVDLGGALTTRATLHNVSIIEDLELGIGDTITIYRSNMVIPKVDDNLTRSNTLVLPKTCPCCGHKAEIHNNKGSKTLHCTNPDCEAKLLSKLEHFCSRKCMNIDGMSEATLEKLISLEYIGSFQCIYYLSDYRDELILLDGFGVKSVDKLLLSIEKSRNVKLENFIAALGIPNIGLSAAKAISGAMNGDFKALIGAINLGFDWRTIEDFGQVTADSINGYFDLHYDEIINLANEMNFVVEEKKEVKDNPFMGKSVCVTGKLVHFTRDSINAKIVELGAKVASGVSAKTDYLVTNTPDSGSSKNVNAKKYDTKIITEQQFLDVIGE